MGVLRSLSFPHRENVLRRRHGDRGLGSRLARGFSCLALRASARSTRKLSLLIFEDPLSGMTALPGAG